MTEQSGPVEMPVGVCADDPPFDKAPAPWILDGRGVVMLHKRPSSTLLTRWIPRALKARYAGGPAAVMLVDYATSPAGPYRELLFIPGRFRLEGRVLPVITRILVSTWASVANGRLNWAIPKEQACFDVRRKQRSEHWRVEQDGNLLLDLSVRAVGPRVPVTTRLLPASWATVAQPREDRFLLTHLESRGRSGLARIVNVAYGGSRFPDLTDQPPWLTLSIDPFRMTFPEARLS